jgi:hypothetical protein
MVGKERSRLRPYQDNQDGAEVWVHRGVDGTVFEDDDVLGKPNGETRGDDGVGWMGQVICIYPCIPLILLEKMKGIKRYGY